MLDDCKRIYREAFSDEDTEFEEKLFKHCGGYIKSLEVDGSTVSMLFALPCKLKIGNTERNGSYIFAAATLKSARGKGYMSRLIDYVSSQENGFLFLRPANESLIEFYKKLGFSEIEAVGDDVLSPQILPEDKFEALVCDIKGLEDNRPFLAMHKGMDGIYKIHFPYSME